MKKTDLIRKWTNLWIKINEVEKLLSNVLKLSSKDLFLADEIVISKKELEYYEKWINRLKSWESLEYVINKAVFFSLDFFVDSRVLIPRDDTEVLVEKAISSIKDKDINLIDIWTWSSCIPISIIKNTKQCIKKSYAVDISKKALEVSKINIKNHNLENKIEIIESNLLDFLYTDKINLEKDIIITANLPYIKNNDFENMSKETIKYEPDSALYGWKKTWFELYEILIKQILDLKNDTLKDKNIILFIEIWFDQYNYSKSYLEKINLEWKYYEDNSLIKRCIEIKL